MKKIISLILAMASISFTAFAAESLEIHNDKVVANGTTVQLQNAPYMYATEGELYVPCDEALHAIGAAVGWSSEKNSIICIYNGKTSYICTDGTVEADGIKNTYKAEFKNGIFYVSKALFENVVHTTVTAVGDIKKYSVVTLIGEEARCTVNNADVPLFEKAYMHKNQAYLPIDDILPALGYAMGWDNALSAVVCIKDGVTSYVFPSRNNIWVGPTEYIFDDKPLVISGRTYVSAGLFTTLTGCEVNISGELASYKSGASIANSVRSDTFRLPGNSVVSGGGITVVDGFGMELVGISEQSAKNYAGVINAVAASLDSNITVYNMIVPTASEYYAPIGLYTNQLSGIQTSYANLSDRVVPVNVYDILAEKAGEKIYFSTDHHWTQRGAYYAYKEFMEYQGIAVPELWNFENIPSYSFVGSLAGFARGTYAGTVMRNSPELLERFVPKYATVGTVYYDQDMTRMGGTVKAVNTGTNAYYAFIGGDNPITVFYTEAQSDKTLVIIKESFGNAFATWAFNDYKKVCIVDPRRFNGFGGNYNSFNLNRFCRNVGATDVMFINYPVAVSSSGIRTAILNMKYGVA